MQDIQKTGTKTGTEQTGNTKAVCSKSRRWAMTIFSEEERLIFDNLDNVKYSVRGTEICPTTKKKHYQAYVHLKNPRTFNGLKKQLPTTHIEKAHHSDKDNRRYCIKNETEITERGELAYTINDKLTECNYNIEEFMQTYPDEYCRNRNGIKEIVNLYKTVIERSFKPPKVIWLYGPTGAGKTRYAFELGCTPVQYQHGFFSNWDGKRICLEEMRGEIPYPELLKLLDGYHNYYSVNIKGGQKLVDLDIIVITSPFRPDEIYIHQLEKKDSINQLLRRITDIRYMGPTKE